MQSHVGTTRLSCLAGNVTDVVLCVWSLVSSFCSIYRNFTHRSTASRHHVARPLHRRKEVSWTEYCSELIGCEVETNIQKVGDLLSSYGRVQGSSDAATVAETVEDLKTAIELLELDLEDLQECVRVVEEHGDRWGLGPTEVRGRRAFVDRIGRDVDVSTGGG